jgi:hypothetical protein
MPYQRCSCHAGRCRWDFNRYPARLCRDAGGDGSWLEPPKSFFSYVWLCSCFKLHAHLLLAGNVMAPVTEDQMAIASAGPNLNAYAAARRRHIARRSKPTTRAHRRRGARHSTSGSRPLSPRQASEPARERHRYRSQNEAVLKARCH